MLHFNLKETQAGVKVHNLWNFSCEDNFFFFLAKSSLLRHFQRERPNKNCVTSLGRDSLGLTNLHWICSVVVFTLIFACALCNLTIILSNTSFLLICKKDFLRSCVLWNKCLNECKNYEIFWKFSRKILFLEVFTVWVEYIKIIAFSNGWKAWFKVQEPFGFIILFLCDSRPFILRIKLRILNESQKRE